MTDKKDSPSKGPERAVPEAGGAKRPFATLDLKAKEVKPAADASAPTPPAAAWPQGAQPKATDTGVGRSQAETAAKVAAAAATVSGSGAAKTGSASPIPVTGEAASSRGGLSGALTHLAAGLAGGVVVLLAWQVLDPLGGSRSASPEMTKRLAALEATVRERTSAPTTDPAAIVAQATQAAAKQSEELSRRLAAVSEAQAQLAAETKVLKDAQAKSSAAGNAGERLARLEEQIGTMAKAATAEPDRAGRIPQLAQLTGKVVDLEQQLATRLDRLRADVLQDVETRVGANTETSEAAKSGTQRIDREVAGIKSDTTRLGQRLDQLKGSQDKLEAMANTLQAGQTRLQSDLKAAQTEIARELAGVAKPADVARAVTPLTDKLAALEGSMQGVVSAEETRRTNAERIVLSLELGNLKRAMERGSRYQSELAEVKRLAGTRLDLAALERYQTTGVSTLPELTRDFRTVANAVIDADATPEGAGVVDRLMTGAKSIVRVRRTTHADGDTSAEAIVARMEAALADGRLVDVLGEAKKLPPRSLTPAQAWLSKVEARQAVDAALVGIDNALKSSLGGAPAAAPKGGRS
jgi:hypothetical protein